MALGLNLLRAFTLLALHLLLPDGLAQESNYDQKPEEKKLFDFVYNNQKTKSDTRSLPFRRFIQLYSRNSGRHVRINADRSVDAVGKDGDKYAKLVIESVSFGRVRIRGSATDFYLCVDKRGRLRARVRGKWRDNCVFTDRLADNAYTEFSSVKYNNSLVAFNRRGRPRHVQKSYKGGIKAVQFIERASNIRLYRGRKYKINRRRGSNRIDLYRKKQPYETIHVSLKRWREFKRWLKLNKRIETTKASSLTTTAAPINATIVQLSSNPTKSVKIL
ncbi:Fibroblast growth factor [Desmophyllum pertusum]|uniref:Fibroblast growth factor n=1 Tax=Desmophyllum pertusum TaxID=174260 RepID=A0A9W9YE66_9CNID|nr:Fibroblast growth factor [Desmophyllum pertusum]